MLLFWNCAGRDFLSWFSEEDSFSKMRMSNITNISNTQSEEQQASTSNFKQEIAKH